MNENHQRVLCYVTVLYGYCSFVSNREHDLTTDDDLILVQTWTGYGPSIHLSYYYPEWWTMILGGGGCYYYSILPHVPPVLY
jgi:hypothetical protein